MDKIVNALLEQGLRVARASSGGESTQLLHQIVEAVFVAERGWQIESGDDPFDAISQYYLVTVGDVPAGCARIVDPLGFPEAAAALSNRGNRCRLPMESDFPLDGHIPDRDGYIEVGRFVLLPEFRGIGGLAALMGTGYLYALRRRRPGAVCLSNTDLTRIYLKIGLEAMSESFPAANYGGAQPMIIRTEGMVPVWRDRFLEMERYGVVAI